MKRNFAIIFSAGLVDSKSFPNLDVCKKDAEAIKRLLEAAEHFDDIKIYHDLNSDDFISFLSLPEGMENQLGDLFIYFSGHGAEINEEFFLVTKNFNKEFPSSTGVSELIFYNKLRELDAKNTIVVKDACYSGRNLMKSSDSRRAPPLENLFVFSSSLSDEQTPAGHELSPYTDMFIESAVTCRDKGQVDYLDISRLLQDLMRQRRDSTHSPHYGFQGTLNAVFCDDATKLLKIRKDYEVADQEKLYLAYEEVTEISEEDLIKSAELRIIEKSDAQNFINGFNLYFNSEFPKIEVIKKFFTPISRSNGSFNYISDCENIVRNLQKLEKTDDFVIGVSERVKKKSLSNGIADIYLQLQPPEYYTVFDLSLNIDMKAVHQIFYLSPISTIFSREALEVVFVPRLYSCAIFWHSDSQRLRDIGVYSDDIENKTWDMIVVEWNGHADFDHSVIFRKFFENGRSSVAATIAALRKNSEATRPC